jgi:hypothetical protein
MPAAERFGRAQLLGRRRPPPRTRAGAPPPPAKAAAPRPERRPCDVPPSGPRPPSPGPTRPPDAAGKRRRRPPLQEYIRHLIFERLAQGAPALGGRRPARPGRASAAAARLRGAAGGRAPRGGALSRFSARPAGRRPPPAAARRRSEPLPRPAGGLLAPGPLGPRPSPPTPPPPTPAPAPTPTPPPGAIVDVLRKLMKLPWADCERYVLKCMLKVGTPQGEAQLRARPERLTCPAPTLIITTHPPCPAPRPLLPRPLQVVRVRFSHISLIASLAGGLAQVGARAAVAFDRRPAPVWPDRF